MNTVPKGWCFCKIDDLSKYIFDGPFGSNLKSSDYTKSGVLVARLENVSWLNFEHDKKTFISEEKFSSLAHHELQAGDILVGSFVDDEVRTCLVPENLNYRIINKADVFCIRSDKKHVNAKYVLYKLASSATYRQLSGTAVHGATRPRIRLSDLRKFVIELPPLSEQHRIAAKIDNLSLRSILARNEIERGSSLIKKYKDAIVVEALRGRLSEKWRNNASSTRVLTSSELTRLRKSVVDVRGPTGRVRRYVEAVKPTWKPSLELPDAWRWVSVDAVTSMIQYGSSAKTNDDPNGVPVLRMGNIKDGALDRTDLRYLPSDHEEFPALLLDPGDILFNRTNSFELVGKTAVYDGNRAESFASYLIRLKTVGYEPKLLAYYINSSLGRTWIANVAAQQVGQANVNGTKLSELAIPLMSPEEQREIVRRIERAFAAIDRLAAEAHSAREHLKKLDQAILAKAFRGELVPQDPDDEPASVLLERIRAERAASGPVPKRGRRPRGATA